MNPTKLRALEKASFEFCIVLESYNQASIHQFIKYRDKNYNTRCRVFAFNNTILCKQTGCDTIYKYSCLRSHDLKMAALLRTNPSRSSFDCEFVEKLLEAIQSECPLCLQILREPYQAPCCGQSFCRVCIEKIKTDSEPCSTCNEENFAFFHNKGLEISLHSFLVYCSHKQEG